MRNFFLSFILFTWLTGCSAPTSDNLNHFYDYRISAPQGKIITLPDLTHALQNADVILIGEWHTNSAIHKFPSRVISRLD